MDKYPEITFAVENKFNKLNRDKLSPWIFLNTGNKVSIEDFYGHTIQYQGVSFEGSPREVFWSGFVEPFLEDIFVWAFEFALDYAKKRNSDRREVILYTRECLMNGLCLIYNKMQKTDRNLRGKGSPDQVPIRDVSREIKKMQTKLDEYRDSTIAALEGNTMNRKVKFRFYNKWWFQFILAPILVALFVGLVLLYFQNKSSSRPEDYFQSSSTNDIKNSNISGDIVGRDKIIYKSATSVTSGQTNIDKESKIKISKVKIIRIIEDLSLGINEVKKEYFKGNERIANDFNSRNISSSGIHIKAQMDFAISIKGKVETLLTKAHRDIEDVLLENFNIVDLVEMNEFSEEDKKLSELEKNSIPGLYKQVEDIVRNREIRSLGTISITKDFKL